MKPTEKKADDLTKAYAAYIVSLMLGEFSICPDQAESVGEMQYERAKEIAEDWGIDPELFDNEINAQEEVMRNSAPEKWDKIRMKMADKLSIDNINKIHWAIVDVGLTFGYVNEGIIGCILKEVETLGLTLEGTVIMICARLREDKHIVLDTEPTSVTMKRILMQAIGSEDALS